MREKPLVLIVDDEPDIRDLLKFKLSGNGFDVAEAGDGVEGVEMARKTKPDIIIMDLVMPRMDGAAALFKIKEDEDLKDIKIFMFTGKGDPRPEFAEVNRKFARESGAVDFIRKESDLNELVAKLQHTVQETRDDEKFKEEREKLQEGI